LPDDTLKLEALKVNGHEVTYEGSQAVAFRLNTAGDLIGFVGSNCREITVDGRTFAFADKPLPLLAWCPVAPERRVAGGALFQAVVHAPGTIRIPLGDLPPQLEVIAEGPTPGSRGHAVTSRVEAQTLIIEVGPHDIGRWLWGK